MNHSTLAGRNRRNYVVGVRVEDKPEYYGDIGGVTGREGPALGGKVCLQDLGSGRLLHKLFSCRPRI